MAETEVLIVGARPAGLMLALELAPQPIPFRITKASLVRSDKSRALVLHPRTLEFLARHGMSKTSSAAVPSTIQSASSLTRNSSSRLI